MAPQNGRFGEFLVFSPKIAFFEGFEIDNILSYKSYTVAKTGISPQRKLGSLRKKLMFIR